MPTSNPMIAAVEVDLADLSIPPFQRGPKTFAEKIAAEWDPFLADPLKVGRITDLKSSPMWVLDGAQRFTALTLKAEEDRSITKAFAFVQDMTRKEAYDYCLAANTERIKFEMFDRFPVLVAKGDKVAKVMVAAAKDSGVTFLVRQQKPDVPLVRSVSSAAGWVENILPWNENELELATNGLVWGLTMLKSWMQETNRKGFPPAWTIEGAATLGLFYDGAVDAAQVGKLLPSWTALKTTTGKGWKARYEARSLLLAETVNTSHRGTFSQAPDGNHQACLTPQQAGTTAVPHGHSTRQCQLVRGWTAVRTSSHHTYRQICGLTRAFRPGFALRGDG